MAPTRRPLRRPRPSTRRLRTGLRAACWRALTTPTAQGVLRWVLAAQAAHPSPSRAVAVVAAAVAVVAAAVAAAVTAVGTSRRHSPGSTRSALRFRASHARSQTRAVRAAQRPSRWARPARARAHARLVPQCGVAGLACRPLPRARWRVLDHPQRPHLGQTRVRCLFSSRSNARTDLTCFICMDVDSHADAYMPCCLYRVHRACIATWHALGQNKTKHVIMAPKQDNGWTPVAMHECMSARTAVLRYCPRVSRASKYLYLQHHLNATIDILTFTNIISLYLGATMSPSLPA